MHLNKTITAARRTAGIDEYYFSRKLAEVRALSTAQNPVINLGIGNPDLPPPPEVVDALVQAAHNPQHHGYQPYNGIPALRQAIARFMYRMYGYQPDADNMVLPLIGSKEGIVHISLAFLNEGDEVLVPDPGYPAYAAAARLAGATAKTYTVNSHGAPVNLDELRCLDTCKVKILWVNFPHMPTGRMADRQMLSDLLAFARERNLLIVNDSAYALIGNADPISLLTLPGASEVALELHSLSKSHNMAGWRLGWVTGKQLFIESILKIKSNMDSGMFLPAQLAAIAALGAERSWFVGLNQIYNSRKEQVCKILQLLGCTWQTEQAGLFVWAKLPEGVSDTALVDEVLYGARVFITPGSVFGVNGKGYIRASLCADVDKIAEAGSRIATWKQGKPQQKEAVPLKS
ncbi:MAG: aminotransferase [Cyclobacteriaceae bacterium]|nr:MAG: aminotransferase [Cyclobacteriaceae bacterium]